MYLSELSGKITHLRYATKRGKRYFFSAWINKVFTGIVIDFNSGQPEITLNPEPNKKHGLDKEQENILLQHCINIFADKIK